MCAWFIHGKGSDAFFNLVGNKFFSLVFWLLGQPIKDTLCGTKVLRKADYEKIAASFVPYFGDFDPFGDFDLLFEMKLNLKIVEIPVRYGNERTERLISAAGNTAGFY